MNVLPNIYNTSGLNIQSEELFEHLLKKDKVQIERIVSPNSRNLNAEWYNQATDEWVLLLSGSAVIEYEHNETVKLTAGDYLFLPSYKKHRVIETQAENGISIWLAIHF